jgi:hypothetical protein
MFVQFLRYVGVKQRTQPPTTYDGCLAFSKNAPLHTFFFVMSDVRITPVNFDTSSTPLSCVELHKVLQARPESSPPVGESLDIT